MTKLKTKVVQYVFELFSSNFAKVNINIILRQI